MIVSRQTLVTSPLPRRLFIAGGIESPRLYSQTYFGTKRLVEEYVDEGTLYLLCRSPLVEKCLAYLNEHPSVSDHERKEFFRQMGKNYGRTVGRSTSNYLTITGIMSFGRSMSCLLSFCKIFDLITR